MSSFHDEEFGEITVRRSAKSRAMKASIAPDGRLRISLPSYVPLVMAKRMVSSSRRELRKLLEAQPRLQFTSGMQIGKSHSLQQRSGSHFSVVKQGQQIIVTLASETIDAPNVQAAIREVTLGALRKEAKHYLPKRLDYLARQHGFSYKSVRFSHASSRWGSCSSNGTISLNIALMMLSFELIDYVLLHELAHTKEMNHSSAFWKLVEMVDPLYKLHRRQLKTHTPNI